MARRAAREAFEVRRMAPAADFALVCRVRSLWIFCPAALARAGYPGGRIAFGAGTGALTLAVLSLAVLAFVMGCFGEAVFCRIALALRCPCMALPTDGLGAVVFVDVLAGQTSSSNPRRSNRIPAPCLAANARPWRTENGSPTRWAGWGAVGICIILMWVEESQGFDILYQGPDRRKTKNCDTIQTEQCLLKQKTEPTAWLFWRAQKR